MVDLHQCDSFFLKRLKKYMMTLVFAKKLVRFAKSPLYDEHFLCDIICGEGLKDWSIPQKLKVMKLLTQHTCDIGNSFSVNVIAVTCRPRFKYQNAYINYWKAVLCTNHV